jgi:hypothetical protein
MQFLNARVLTQVHRRPRPAEMAQIVATAGRPRIVLDIRLPDRA